MPTIGQMLHSSWTARNGSPQGIEAITQAADGRLWIGATGGLSSFDGLTFTKFQSMRGDAAFPSFPVVSVCAARDGTIYAGFYHAGLARIGPDGHFTLITTADGAPLQFINELKQSPDGTMWALNNYRSLIRLGRDGQWHIEETPGSPDTEIRSFFIDSTNTLWLPAGEHLYRRPLSQANYSMTSIPAAYRMVFAEAADRTVWASDFIVAGARTRMLHFDGAGHLIANTVATFADLSAMSFARDGTLWMATQELGLQRKIAGAGDPSRRTPAAEILDRYKDTDGLSSNAVSTLLVDADGSIWAGGRRGLDRFRSGAITPFVRATPNRRWLICSDGSGDVWIGSGANTLYQVAHGRTRKFTGVRDMFFLSCGSHGRVWFLNHAAVSSMHAGRISTVPPPPGSIAYGIRSVTETPDHSLLAAPADATLGLWAYKRKRWSRMTGAGPLARAPSVAAMDTSGQLWTGYNSGEIAVQGPHGTSTFTAENTGLVLIRAFAETPAGMMAAGFNGVAVLRDGTFHLLRLADQTLTSQITGVIGSLNGDVWLNGSSGIVHITQAELERARKDPNSLLNANVIKEGEFTGSSFLLQQSPSAVRDGEGKLWFSQLNGVMSIDPRQAVASAKLPVLSFRSITADGHGTGRNKTFAPHPETLSIQYFGLDLGAAEQVIYRYKLEPYDSRWQEVGHRTEAIYTHLRPGRYSFYVCASSGDGRWTDPLSTGSFTILPRFYQSSWFLCLSLTAIFFLIWLLATMRIRSMAQGIRGQAEARADERVRIARELHDTLLQGIQGLLLTFHVATQQIRPEEESRRVLEKALSTADKIIIEGRNRVNDLRSTRLTAAEFIEFLENVCSDLNAGGTVSFCVHKTGTPLELQVQVLEQVSNIAREALTNAFRHAEASEIKVTLDYERRRFRMECADNGKGFVLHKDHPVSKRGHWGLRGMKERADQVGGRFTCVSQPNEGTRILLEIPANRAYNAPKRLDFFRKGASRRA